MSTASDPVAWLRAQVEARRAAAAGLAAATGLSWTMCRNDNFDYTVHGSDPDEPVADTWRKDVAEWVRDNDPQAIIADCEKDLAILDEHGPDDTFGPDDVCCCACGDRPQVPFPCKTVRLLAGGYRYQPGYAETWREPEDKPPADVREVSPGLWTSGPSLVELDAYGADPRKPETEGPRGCCGSWPGQPHDPEHCTAGTEATG